MASEDRFIEGEFSFFGAEYKGVDVQPVMLQVDDDGGFLFEHLQDVQSVDDPRMHAWGVYGRNALGLPEHLYDAPSKMAALKLAYMLIDTKVDDD